MKKSDDYYMKIWMKLAKKSLGAAQVYDKASMYSHAQRMTRVGKYCLNRYDKAHLKMISKNQERSQQTAGAIIIAILIVAVIYYIIKH